MTREFTYKYCMDACLEYATVIYQQDEADAILYCRQMCLEVKEKENSRKLKAVANLKK